FIGLPVMSNALTCGSSSGSSPSSGLSRTTSESFQTRSAVAPGVVLTPLHRNTPKDVMESQSPMGRPSTVKDIADAVMYLTDVPLRSRSVATQTSYVVSRAEIDRSAELADLVWSASPPESTLTCQSALPIAISRPITSRCDPRFQRPEFRRPNGTPT